MNIIINNNKIELPEKSTLSFALKQTEIINFKGIAVAVNNNVIPKLNWDNHILSDNDKVIIIKATQGG